MLIFTAGKLAIFGPLIFSFPLYSMFFPSAPLLFYFASEGPGHSEDALLTPLKTIPLTNCYGHPQEVLGDVFFSNRVPGYLWLISSLFLRNFPPLDLRTLLGLPSRSYHSKAFIPPD